MTSKLQNDFKSLREQLLKSAPQPSWRESPEVPAKAAMEFHRWLKEEYKPSNSTPPRERPVLQHNPEYSQSLAKLKDLYLQAKGAPEPKE